MSHSPSIYMGPIAIQVTNIARLTDFYQQFLGMKIIQQDKKTVLLGIEESSLLLLKEQENQSIPPTNQSSTLYHVAFRVPQRTDLGRAIQYFTDHNYPLQGASDHHVSEAVYLSDPEDNGIEIYWDRPAETWHGSNGQVHMTTVPLDINSLFQETRKQKRSWEGLPNGTQIGHIHLTVNNLQPAKAFFQGVLDFQLTHSYPNAYFFARNSYHHHIAVNNWHPSSYARNNNNPVGLQSYTIGLANMEEQNKLLQRVRESDIPVEQMDDFLIFRDPWKVAVIIGTKNNIQKAGFNSQLFSICDKNNETPK